MTRPPSLRTIVLAGLAVLNVAVVGGIVETVYTRARREAHAALRGDLRFRAATFAGIPEIGRKGLEFEASPRTMPEYDTPGSGAYVVIVDPAGKAVVRSPSVGKQPLEPSGAWTAGAFVFDEREQGPDGIPVAVVTHSFVVASERPSAKFPDWAPPSEEQRRYRVVVAADTRPRDARLASLLGFLGLVAAGALGLTAIGGWLVARAVLRPIREMTDEAAALTPEDTSRRLRPETVVRELGSLSGTLNSALDRLGDAVDRQRRFTSDASHELRTPLAVLRGNVELLLRRDRSAQEYRDGLERQRRIVTRMTEITENLLVLARADDGRAHVRHAPVAMHELTRGVCDEFESLAREDRVALECVADEPVAIEGDPLYLGELVQNLVSNAVKFTPAGGSVRVGLHRENGHAVLDVADSGPGIAPEDRERIFERFLRLNHGRDRHEGAGLGLAIVQWIVRAHEGRIEVLDRAGGGAVFRVRLPLVAGLDGSS